MGGGGGEGGGLHRKIKYKLKHAFRLPETRSGRKLVAMIWEHEVHWVHDSSRYAITNEQKRGGPKAGAMTSRAHPKMTEYTKTAKRTRTNANFVPQTRKRTRYEDCQRGNWK